MNQIKEVFERIIELSTIIGENQFRTRAYSNALAVMSGMGEITDVKQVRNIKGFGDSICTAVQQVLATGTCDKLEGLKKVAPPEGVLELKKIPGVGPKTALKLWKNHNVTSLADLSYKLASGAMKDDKLKQAVEFAMTANERTPIGMIRPDVEPLLCAFLLVPGVLSGDFAGSMRRGKETVRDIDILLKVAELTDEVRAGVKSVLGADYVEAEGDRKIRAKLNGVQIDILFVPEEEYGAALCYFTGSKEHNIEMRKRAMDRGWRLNEKGLLNERGVTVASEREEDIYEALGVPFLPPELRQDGTEVGKSVPENLISFNDLRGLLHNHTNWSDGLDTIEEMVDYAIASGYQYLAITDHTKALVALANGLSEERWLEQREGVKILRGIAEQQGSTFRIYHSAEMDVLGDGSCDYSDEIIQQLDFILLALHRQPQKDIQLRFLKAVEHVRNLCPDKTIILAHPMGRQFGKSDIPEGNWGEFFRQCAEYNVVFEINSMPQRLDLPDRLCKVAKAQGCKFAINTDSHRRTHMDMKDNGIIVARRAWLERDDVINTREDPFA